MRARVCARVCDRRYALSLSLAVVGSKPSNPGVVGGSATRPRSGHASRSTWTCAAARRRPRSGHAPRSTWTCAAARRSPRGAAASSIVAGAAGTGGEPKAATDLGPRCPAAAACRPRTRRGRRPRGSYAEWSRATTLMRRAPSRLYLEREELRCVVESRHPDAARAVSAIPRTRRGRRLRGSRPSPALRTPVDGDGDGGEARERESRESREPREPREPRESPPKNRATRCASATRCERSCRPPPARRADTRSRTARDRATDADAGGTTAPPPAGAPGPPPLPPRPILFERGVSSRAPFSRARRGTRGAPFSRLSSRTTLEDTPRSRTRGKGRAVSLQASLVAAPDANLTPHPPIGCPTTSPRPAVVSMMSPRRWPSPRRPGRRPLRRTAGSAPRPRRRRSRAAWGGRRHIFSPAAHCKHGVTHRTGM